MENVDDRVGFVVGTIVDFCVGALTFRVGAFVDGASAGTAGHSCRDGVPSAVYG